MAKIQLGPQTYAYPMPSFLVGANVAGKPNFLAVAWGGIANAEPPMISVAIRHNRYSLQGIRENQTFSVNIPSVDMIAETDFCGMESGRRVDKAEVCGFKVFYGKLKTAPFIEQCPVNLECQVEHVLDLGTHDFFVGRIVEVYASEECLTDGKPDTAKMKPFIFTTTPGNTYQGFGPVIAQAFCVGKKLKGK